MCEKIADMVQGVMYIVYYGVCHEYFCQQVLFLDTE